MWFELLRVTGDFEGVIYLQEKKSRKNRFRPDLALLLLPALCCKVLWAVLLTPY